MWTGLTTQSSERGHQAAAAAAAAAAPVCEALSQLAVGVVRRNSLVRHGAVPAALSVLQAYSEDPITCEASCRALSNLFLGSNGAGPAVCWRYETALRPTTPMRCAPRPVAAPPRPVTAHASARLPNGLRLHFVSQPDVSFLYREIFTERCYAKHGVTVRPGDTVLDVGANVGVFALWAGSEGARRVVCCEPAPRTFAALRLTLAADENVAALAGCSLLPLNVGLAERAASASFTTYTRAAGWSTLVQGTEHEAEVMRNVAAYASTLPLQLPPFLADAVRASPPFRALVCARTRHLLGAKQSSRVQLCSLSELLVSLDTHGGPGWASGGEVSLLKVDVEGGELGVLRGIRDAKDWRRIQQVVAEVHDVEGRVEVVCALLRGAGGFSRVEVEQPIPGSSLYCVYASRGER